MKLSKTFNSLLMNQGKWIINNRNVIGSEKGQGE